MLDTISHPTWRLLGLGVAASYAALGLASIVAPATAGRVFFALEPEPEQAASPPASAEADAGPDKRHPAAAAAASPAGSGSDLLLLVPLLGARDVSFGAALYLFHHARWDRQMGWLILSGTVLCVADVVAVWRRKGAGLGAVLAGGSAVCTLVGWALTKSEV